LLARVAEDQLEVRVRGDGRRGVGTDGADVDAFVHRLEEPGERARAAVHGRDYTGYPEMAPGIMGSEIAPISSGSPHDLHHRTEWRLPNIRPAVSRVRVCCTRGVGPTTYPSTPR